MEQLIIKKTWMDSNMYQINIKAYSKHVIADTYTYVCTEKMNELIAKLTEFFEWKVNRVEWKTSQRGNEYGIDVELCFYGDKLGHLCCDIFMEIGDSGVGVDGECKFKISNFDYQNLISFANKLKEMNNAEIGYAVNLT